ncbi:MAG TPA: phenylalanine--tRNA ligase subunit alpha [Candidatus Marinimicrobia bacterium]|nr:phenylalanine--tRNA ligase subunit alpha [Candidatus Neomarinimicrobiota bacterium]
MNSLYKEIESIRGRFAADLESVSPGQESEILRHRYLGRKGALNALFKKMAALSVDEKKEAGAAINELKNELSLQLEEKNASSIRQVKNREKSDFTLPGYPFPMGTLHPITTAVSEILGIFSRLGFDVATGYEVETDWYNFGSLNFPENHPARDMQDTFYTESGHLLRTHTSPVQTRYMTSHQPPVRIVAPGRVFRNEAVSARSYCVFHQIEGLYVDKKVTFRDLKGTLDLFGRMYFGKSAKIRFRTSFFPFTEPSAEVDVSCFLCQGKGCRVCKQTGWLEILGCGMVDPNVFTSVGYNPESVTGYAFGMGIERMVMQKFGIHDIRLFYENDKAFLSQFY